MTNTKLGKNATRILAYLERHQRTYYASQFHNGDGRNDCAGCEELVRKGLAVVVGRQEDPYAAYRSITIQLP